MNLLYGFLIGMLISVIFAPEQVGINMHKHFNQIKAGWDSVP